MKERTRKLEALRNAAMRLAEAKGGKAIATFMPNHAAADVEAHSIWWRYASALVALSNQVHAGVEPTAEWDVFYAHLQGAGGVDAEAREIIAAVDEGGAARVSGHLDTARAALRQAMDAAPMDAHLAAELAEADRRLLHAIGMVEGLNVHRETE